MPVPEKKRGMLTYFTNDFGHIFFRKKNGIGARAPIKKYHILSP